MKTKILFIAACVCFLLASCEYDNYDAPSAKLSGRVVYNDAPVGVRTNGTQMGMNCTPRVRCTLPRTARSLRPCSTDNINWFACRVHLGKTSLWIR